MKRILLVDDDPCLLESLQRQFRPHRHEWQVETAANGKEAMRLVRERLFDLVITDILMPEQDGIETVVELRRSFPSIKVIAMSGGGRYVGKEFLEHARQLGAHRTFEKPFDAGALLDAVRSLLAQEPAGSSPSRETS